MKVCRKITDVIAKVCEIICMVMIAALVLGMWQPDFLCRIIDQIAAL